MTLATPLSPADFAAALEDYYYEAAEDAREVRVGLRDSSRAAEIYARHATRLYSREQADALAQARDAAEDADEREQLDRLWHAAAGGVAARDVIQAAQDLTNDRLAYRVEWDGEPRSLNDLGALLGVEPDFDRREQIFALTCTAAEHFAQREIELAQRSQQLRSDVYGMDGEIEIAQHRMGIDIFAFADQIEQVADRTADSYASRTARIFPELLGRDVKNPSRAHASYMRPLRIYDEVFTREKMLDVCLASLSDLGYDLDDIPTIRPDLEDRPQKNPRACVITSKVPQEVHLIIRPEGGLTDYQAFLHEAGHALHFGLTDPALPFAYRDLSRDHALTEIYSFVVERLTHEPAWHVHHFGVTPEHAERICAHIRFIDATLFRRYAAKLRYELGFWNDPADVDNPAKYARLLSVNTRMTYPPSQYAEDIDPGLYAADYLRAWRTSEQVIEALRDEHGDEWFRSRQAGDRLRELFRQGVRPSNEEVGRQFGHEPDDWAALERALSH